MASIAWATTCTGGLKDAALSAVTKDATFDTVMGEIKFGKNGEWAHPRVVQVQFRGIENHEADQFKDGSKQVVVNPGAMASGRLIFPYAAALRSE